MDIKNVPKHVYLREWIRKNIMDKTFANGEKLLSENILAEKFGISRQTVRQAIGALEAEGLLERRRGSGTYICSSNIQSHPQTMNIGVITTYVDDYIFPGIIKGIDTVLSHYGYGMSLGITYNKVENEGKLLRSLLDKGIDGLIVEATKSALPNPNLDIYKEFDAQGIPYIFINGYYPALPYNKVIMDDEYGGYTAASTLINAGHRKIGGIFKSDDIQGHSRYAGFAKALKNSGIILNDSSVVWYTTEDVESFFSGEFDKIIMSRLSRCTGVVCYNDQIALKFMDMLARNDKKVPDDMSIVSFDDSNLATIQSVGITSVAHAGAHLGEQAADRIIKLIDRPEEDQTLVMKPQMVERDSVKIL